MEREPRLVTIYGLELVSFEAPVAELRVHCTKGTYVRTLIEDIGERLGCGAHVIGLRRNGVGPFDDINMIDMEGLEAVAREGHYALDELLLPMESGLTQWPGVRLTGDAAFYLRQGQPVLVPKAPTAGWVRLYEG